MNKAYLNWSSGKDAALALFFLLEDRDIKVEKLVTTLDSTTSRISMHGLRKELLLQQSKNLQLPLQIIELPGNVPLKEYNFIMRRETSALIEQGFTHSVFGDIFLEDLRRYREGQLSKIGIKALFPLWNMDTSELMKRFIKEGFKAITVCVNAKTLDKSFCGRIIDKQFLEDLPNNVDPCGENGEFHTFVFDGPIFHKPVKFLIGDVYSDFKENENESGLNLQKRTWDNNFWYCDIFPE